ncbi:MAG TPA: HAMP domain-containing sensor histidine kinase [Acidimicrobiales bacterium]|nr:HAMP domain-containing sensor histidine kinase [Acidimicrobiales bacterium]
MKLRRQLVITMIILVAVGLAAVNLITFTSLHSYLYGRVDDQLQGASQQMASYVTRARQNGFNVTRASIASHVGPDLYVELIDPAGHVVVARPSSTQDLVDPAPELPARLAVTGVPSPDTDPRPGAYRPLNDDIDVGSAGGHGPEYRLEATSLPGYTLVVATSLASVTATLNSLRTIELAVSLGLLAALLVLMTLLIRQGLRPLEDMAKEADAIAAGDLSRRVQPTEGDSEIARLGRALNGMLAQIETAFAQRARSEERLRSFLSDASHELRTPLTSIRGYAELLQKDALEDRAARDRALSRIEREAARMGVLVGDLGLLAREGESPEPARYRVDLAAVAAEVVADARTMDGDRSIELHAPDEVPVAGDDARLEQMVHNLIGNALTHTPAGTPVEVDVSLRGEQAVLQVKDRGPGMNHEEASHVFDRFYRGDADRLDGGSGLGLFIVATLARTFGGSASVDTAVGRGSTFQVVLPAFPGALNGNGNGSSRRHHAGID